MQDNDNIIHEVGFRTVFANCNGALLNVTFDDECIHHYGHHKFTMDDDRQGEAATRVVDEVDEDGPLLSAASCTHHRASSAGSIFFS